MSNHTRNHLMSKSLRALIPVAILLLLVPPVVRKNSIFNLM